MRELWARRLTSADHVGRRVTRRLEPRLQRGPQGIEGGNRGRCPLANEMLGGDGDRGVGGDRTQEERKAKHGNTGGSGRADPYHGQMVSTDALRPVPKAELHLHLDGSMRPETAVELAAPLGLSVDLDEARRRMVAPEHGESQSQLLKYFDLPIALLQTGDALERVTSELVEDLMRDGVRYAEVRWAPRLHLERGLSVTAVLEAVASGIARAVQTHGTATPLIGLIVTAMRSHPPAANVELARTAAAFGPPILGFDLAGPEASGPRPHTPLPSTRRAMAGSR